MNSIKQVLLFLFAGVLLVGCTKAKYKKTKGGMPYQLFASKDTQKVRAGNFVKIQITQKIKDSVYFTTVGTMPQYQQITEMQSPYDISELWPTLKLGDSVITTQMMDTFIKRSPQNIPKEFKKGDKIVTYIKVLQIFTSDSAARADYEKSNQDWLAGEVKTIEKYLADKKITAEKTKSGAFVEIINPGTGPAVDSGKYVTVKYTGTSWSGLKFDSNTDTAFGIRPPYGYLASTGAMIKGFDEGVLALNQGGVARIYVPSILGYAGQPTTPKIKPYEILIFDVEVVEVKDKAPTRADEGAPVNPIKIDTPQPNK